VEEPNRPPEEPTGAPEPPPPLPPLPPEVTTAKEDLRRQVEAGAGSPEELRALAERLREQRAMEDEAWRRSVKPALIQSKKRSFSLRDLQPKVDEVERADRGPMIVLSIVLLVAVLVLVALAAEQSVLWVLLPLVVVLVYAYRHGRQPSTDADGPPPPPDGADGEVDTLGP
jgi:hypothetical protein